MQPDQIKKSKINYPFCQAGGMHHGEKMSFVCVDAQCKSKGLICPVCKQMQHSNHEVIHLKIFLNNIYTQYSNEKEDSSINDINQKLNKLQKTKKTMISTLKQNVKTLAELVRKVQEKIQENYTTLRRIILSQSTVSSKIPNLYKILTTQQDIDIQQIKSEIRKCSELLQMKNNKVQMVNNASKLLDEYNNNTDTFIVHFTNIIADLPKKFEELPLKLKKIGLGQKQEQTKTQYKFSSTYKADDIQLSENEKVALIPVESMGMGGLIFTNSDSANIRKINFKVSKSVSQSVNLGIGNPQNLKEKNFLLEMLQSQSQGFFGISSFGLVLNDYDTPSFVFSEGDIIEIVFNVEEMKLTFSRRNGVQKQQVYPPISAQQANKFTFFCGLTVPGDEISIIQ